MSRELPERETDGETIETLRAQLANVTCRLAEAEETLTAIRTGQVDAIVIRGDKGNEVYTLTGAERPYRRLVESMTEGAAILLHDGTILYCNGRFAEMLGVPLAAAIGGSIQRFFPEGSGDTLDVFLKGGSPARMQLEVELRSANGETLPLLVSLSPMEDEAVPGVALIATDLTAQKRSAVIAANEERLRTANATLKDSDRRKDEFLAMLAHELRNPLAPLNAAAEILRRRALDPALKETCAVIARQTDHLKRLVDELLDVSRITSGKVALKREVMDAAAIVHRAVEISRPHIDAKKHSLIVSLPHAPVRLEADGTRMAQVLGNLLNNAAKYTEDGGKIWLSVDREGTEVVFRVRDTGVGIAPAMLSKVFDLFVQVDRSLDRSQGGLGIGLTLVKSLVELHGGRVAASSNGERAGSEFVVRVPGLPASEAGGQGAPDAADAALAVRPSRILVVDDNVDAATTLAGFLECSGHEVRFVHRGEQALEETASFRPEIVLLDIGLPGMDGYEVARRIRKQSKASDAVLVALTGYGQDNDRKASREAGFDHHLVKPLDINELESLLRSASHAPAR